MLAIPNLITAYTDKLNNVRKMFFLTHSLIGGMMIDDLNVYTRSIDPYSAAVIIETEERIIRTRIDRLSKRYKLFTNEFTTEELNTLRRAVNENEATLITQRAYQWIEAVDFYLTARYEETDTQQEIQQKGEQLREISFLDEEFENMMRGVAI